MPKYLNTFMSPKHVEEMVLDVNDNVIGTIRVKPSSVLWKPKGQHRFYAVSLDKFASWITGSTSGATRVKQ